MHIQPPRSSERRHRRVGRTALSIASVIALVTLATACVTNPPHQVSFPGTYSIDFSAPTLSFPQGYAPVATVVACLDTASAVAFTGGYEMRLVWNGTTYTSPTPVLQPGCGTLRVSVDCCYIPHYVEVTLSKLAAPA